MSASLVGSEMCIRDRAGRHNWGAATTATRRGAPREGGKALGSPGEPWNCLLYTSDAADDM
eukprot:12369103-Alexandrium_andersonii.AAC.1